MIVKNIKKMLFLAPVLTLGHAMCGFVLRQIVLALSQALKNPKYIDFNVSRFKNQYFPNKCQTSIFAICYPM